MKRDMELARKILFEIEAHPSADGPLQQLSIEGYDDEFVSYHIKLLHDAGLIEATDLNAQQSFLWFPGGLTWQGHDFLDTVRNETVWKKTTEIVREKGGTVPFEVLKAIAVKVLTSMFGLS